MANNQYGNFNFGQNRMAGNAFDPQSSHYQWDSSGNESWSPNFASKDWSNAFKSSSTGNKQEVKQTSDQDATSTTNFGSITNSGNNNQVSDFGQLIINNQQYGGNNKSVNISYQGGADTQYKSTPVSDLTLGGYYDVEDSPADTAKFMNKYSDLNSTNQQKYKNQALTSVAKYMALARDNKGTDTVELDKRIQAQPQYHLDMSIVEGAHTFGDQYGKTPAKWTTIKPEDEDFRIDDEIKDEIF